MTDESTPHQGAPTPPSGVPPAYPTAGYPVAGYSAQYPAGYPPPAATQPVSPPRRRSGGWIVALIVGLLVLCVAASCVAGIVGLSRQGGTAWGSAFGDAVALINLDGVISGSGGTGAVTPERFIRQINQAEKDSSVKAIVLRVDSPGGTVAASEEIATLVRQATKPVVVSIGDVGASGAYMVSSQADLIYAMPGSSVGSIGVIAEVPNAESLLKKLGVDFVIVTAGKYKGAGSLYKPLTEEERKLLQQDVDEVYAQFIDIVARGRKMSTATVEGLANGWAWPGSRAKELGLIDRIGGLSDAITEAAKRGGIQGEPRIVQYTEYNPAALLQSLLGQASKLGLPTQDSARDSLPK